MKRMLVNATQQEELRVALVDGQKLYDLSHRNTLPGTEESQRLQRPHHARRAEPRSLLRRLRRGAPRLPAAEGNLQATTSASQPAPGGRTNIRDLLQEGQELIVQVEKEERGNKGAALTTFISLAGRFLVLMPNNPRAGGVSRRIEGEDRDADARGAWTSCRSPTAWARSCAPPASAARAEELQWDLDNLKRQLGRRSTPAAKDRPAPFLVYQESDAVTRALRDYLVGRHRRNPGRRRRRPSATAQEYMQRFMPAEAQRKLKLYNDDVPLFTRFQIESQIESAYSHKVDAALRRQHRHRLHRGAGLDRHQLRARHARRGHRDHGATTPTSKPRTRSRASCASATSAA